MSKKINNGDVNGEHFGDLLFDYMDNTLDESARVRVRKHLKSCVDCRANYEELRATQQLLQSLPDVPPPRVFTLTPEMAAANAKPSFWQRLFASTNAQRYAWGSGLAFTALALMLFSSAFLGRQASGSFAMVSNGLSAGYSAESNSSTDDTALRSSKPNQSAAIPPMLQATVDVDAAGRQADAQTNTALDRYVAPPSAAMEPPAGVVGGGVSPAEAAPTANAAANSAGPPSGDAGVAYSNSVTASTTSSPSTITSPFAYDMYTNPTSQQDGNVQSESQANKASTPNAIVPQLYDPYAKVVSGAVNAYTPPPNTAGPSVEAIVMLSLVVLGTALAVGALLARRRI